MIDLKFHDSDIECLKSCQDAETCLWFSFDNETNACEIFQDCTMLSNELCSNCVSGED